jgi:hypothetical protein
MCQPKRPKKLKLSVNVLLINTGAVEYEMFVKRQQEIDAALKAGLAAHHVHEVPVTAKTVKETAKVIEVQLEGAAGRKSGWFKIISLSLLLVAVFIAGLSASVSPDLCLDLPKPMHAACEDYMQFVGEVRTSMTESVNKMHKEAAGLMNQLESHVETFRADGLALKVMRTRFDSMAARFRSEAQTMKERLSKKYQQFKATVSETVSSLKDWLAKTSFKELLVSVNASMNSYAKSLYEKINATVAKLPIDGSYSDSALLLLQDAKAYLSAQVDHFMSNVKPYTSALAAKLNLYFRNMQQVVNRAEAYLGSELQRLSLAGSAMMKMVNEEMLKFQQDMMAFSMDQSAMFRDLMGKYYSKLDTSLTAVREVMKTNGESARTFMAKTSHSAQSLLEDYQFELIIFGGWISIMLVLQIVL